MRPAGAGKDAGELGPGIGCGHIDDTDGFEPWLRRFDPEQLRLLAALDTAPELALGGDNEMLIERIGMSEDLDPFAAAGYHREDRASGCNDPHVVLQLRHVLFRRPLFRERPR